MSDALPMWMQLEVQSKNLHTVHRLQANQNRIAYWPGADLHHVPTINLCLRGQCRVRYERSAFFTLEEGEALVIAPGVFHQHEPLRSGSCFLSQGIAPKHSDFQLYGKDIMVRGTIPLNRVQSVFYKIIDDRSSQHASWVKDMRAVCHSILHEHTVEQKDQPASFQKMFAYFVRHVYSGISADDIVQVSGVSRSQANKVWSKMYPLPMREAISQHRLYLAKLLLVTDLSMTDIAERCGFASRQQMTRLFQSQESLSPRMWRQQQEGMEHEI
ncbi:MAG: helix-turn-helix domain-containing protein [Planctomycetes bacterium]|nr:helix-turn-helix domain-containing protein [Planctomycetota bacterium]